METMSSQHQPAHAAGGTGIAGQGALLQRGVLLQQVPPVHTHIFHPHVLRQQLRSHTLCRLGRSGLSCIRDLASALAVLKTMPPSISTICTQTVILRTHFVHCARAGGPKAEGEERR